MEIQKWREILIPYELAVSELEIKFNHMIKESRMVGRYSYIEQVHGRVKTLSRLSWIKPRERGSMSKR